MPDRLPPGARVTKTGRVYGLLPEAKHRRKLKLLAEARRKLLAEGLCINGRNHGKAWRARRCRRCWRVKAAYAARAYLAIKAEGLPWPTNPRPRKVRHRSTSVVTYIKAAVVAAVQLAWGEWRFDTNHPAVRTILPYASQPSRDVTAAR